MEKAHGKLEALCEMCSCAKSIAFCRQCVSFICSHCVKSHERMKAFAGHVVSTLEELKQGGVKELSVVDVSNQKCLDHDERKKLFCFDCQQLICRDCVIFDHRDHKSEFVKKAAPSTRNKLAEHLSPLKNLLPDLSTAVNQVRATKQEIQAEGKLLQKQVNAKFQELHEILEQCKARVLRESQDIVDRKIKNLTVQEKDLDLSVGCVQSLVDFVEKTLDNASDEELVTMQEQVVSRIDSEVVKRAASVEPVEKADFGVDICVSEDLQKLCENNVFVCEDKLFIRGDGTRIAEVNEPAGFTMHFVKACDQESTPRIRATLKSLVDQTSLQLEAVPVKKGVYSIEYIPTVRGRHLLLISVDGHPITGSPFSVFVSMPPLKLPVNKPMKEIRNIHPIHIATNSSNELITSNEGRDIAILNKKGEKLRSTSCSQLKNVCAAAVDNDDSVFISDSDSNCLYKFDKDGRLLKKLSTKKGSGPGDFNTPRGVAVHGDRVFVCDRGNHRVQVLTTNLEPLTQFGAQGVGNGQLNGPEGIAVDSEGMLYVSDYINHCIQVFSSNGQFVRSFGKKGSGRGELDGPTGMCVDAGYVYIAEYYNKHVSVFTKDGQFVTSFGSGFIPYPFGVSIDRDGFVYVSCCSGCVDVL